MIIFMPTPTDPNLRALRSVIDRSRMTVREAARLVGMDHTTLNTWYQGTSRPRGEQGVRKLENAVRTLSEHERKMNAGRGDDLVRVGIRLVPLLPKKVGKLVDKTEHVGEDVVMIECKDWGTAAERSGFNVPDDAMFPDLRPGQQVIAEDREAEPNHVVLIEADGERHLRIQRGRGSTAVYCPLDTAFPEYPAARARFLGVVVETITPLPEEEESRHTYRLGMKIRK